jgi:putative DNA primase/helicase
MIFYDEIAENDKPAPHDLNVICMADIQPEPIRWLWPDRIPLGMFSLLAGQPGVGKTTIATSIAAILTTGSRWPYSEHRAEIGDVAILTAEDDPRYTPIPRLIASGADVNRVRAIPSVKRVVNGEKVVDAPVLLSEDMHQLHGLLKTYPDTRLMIFDPLSAYLGVKDSHRDADVRQVLGPLTEFASEHDVAVLGITHLSKNATQSAMARFMGSTGIIAAARTAYLAARHEDELMWLPVKSNVAPNIGGLTYCIQGKTLEGGIKTSCVEWTGQTEVDADEALSQTSMGSAPKRSEAETFLRNMLKDGPALLKDLDDAAEREGIKWATVRRAADELGIERRKENRFQGRWWWCMPDQVEQFNRDQS